jgi:multidrug resistance efflux pump
MLNYPVWTRDGTVRAYVVAVTPEVSGLIVQLPIADNQLVRKGDLLVVIDPRDYAIAVDQAQAAADQANANAENAQQEAERHAHLTNLSTSAEEQQTRDGGSGFCLVRHRNIDPPLMKPVASCVGRRRRGRLIHGASEPAY